MEKRKIYLVRHGKVAMEDNQRRYIGQLDVPLSEEGIRQGQILRKLLEKIPLSSIISSDLFRCRQTAEFINQGRDVSYSSCKELREIHMGEWEGRTFAEITKIFPKEFKARGADIGYYRVSGGESFADCYKRVVTAFQEHIHASKGNLLFVGHAGVNRLILSSILGMPLANLFKISQEYGCLNVIGCTGVSYQVELLNFRSSM